MENLVIVPRAATPNYSFVYSCFTTLYQTSSSEHDKKLIRENLHSLFNQCRILARGYLHEDVHSEVLEVGARDWSPGKAIHPCRLPMRPCVLLPTPLSAHLAVNLRRG